MASSYLSYATFLVIHYPVRLQGLAASLADSKAFKGRQLHLYTGQFTALYIGTLKRKSLSRSTTLGAEKFCSDGSV